MIQTAELPLKPIPRLRSQASVPAISVSTTSVGMSMIAISNLSALTITIDYDGEEGGRSASQRALTQDLPFGHPTDIRKGEHAMSEQFEYDTAYYGGRPMLPGTGLPAWIVAEMLRSGESVDDIVEAYPFLMRSQVTLLAPILMTIPLQELGAPNAE